MQRNPWRLLAFSLLTLGVLAPGVEVSPTFAPRWAAVSFGHKTLPAFEHAQDRFLIVEASGRYEVRRNNPGITAVRTITEAEANALVAGPASTLPTTGESPPVVPVKEPLAKPVATVPANESPLQLRRMQGAWKSTAEQELAELTVSQATGDRRINDLKEQIQGQTARRDSLVQQEIALRLQLARYREWQRQNREDGKANGSDQGGTKSSAATGQSGRRRENREYCEPGLGPFILEQLEVIQREQRSIEFSLKEAISQRDEAKIRQEQLAQQITAKQAYIAVLEAALVH